MFESFGVSLTVARVLPILSGSFLVLSLFLWTRSVAGRTAAWAAALLLCFSPNAIVLSQFIRPYSMHSLLFFWGAIGIYRLVSAEERWGHRHTGLMCASAVNLFLALRLQVTTLIGLVGLTPWLLATVGPGWAHSRPRYYRGIAIGVLVLAGAGGIAVIQSGLAEYLVALAREEPLWAQGSKFYVYHGIFLKYYPTFWGLLPVAWLFAIARKGQPAAFCCSVFTFSLLLHLFFPMRGERYISYLMPFFFALWGMVLADVLPKMPGLAMAAVKRVLPGTGLSGRGDKVIGWLSVGIPILFLLASNSAFYNAAKVIVRGPLHLHPQYNVDWATGTEVLGSLAEAVEIVISTNALSAFYHLNRSDVEYSASHLYEVDTGEEFALDHRTGRPVISKARSLRHLMRCYRTGLVIAESWQWKNSIVGIDDEAASLLVETSEAVDLPPKANLMAFRWYHAGLDRLLEDGSADRPAEQQRNSDGCGPLRKRVSDRKNR